MCLESKRELKKAWRTNSLLSVKKTGDQCFDIGLGQNYLFNHDYAPKVRAIIETTGIEEKLSKMSEFTSTLCGRLSGVR